MAEGVSAAFPERPPLVDRFCREWEALQGTAVTVDSDAEGTQFVADRLAQEELRRVVLWDDTRLRSVGIGSSLESAGIECRWWGEDTAIREAAEAEVGITWADAAVANLGTAVLAADTGAGRSVGLLPPYHILFIRADTVVASRPDAWRIVRAARGGAMPSAMHLVSGPSRTADIEMDLAVGVHGPGRVLAVILP